MTNRSTISFNISYPVEEVEHVIPIRCGDARDVGAIENEILRELILEYAARGVKVIVSRVTTAGAVVNKQSYVEVKDLIKSALKSTIEEFGEKAVVEPSDKKGNIFHRVSVQISGHADIKLKNSEYKLVYSPKNDIEITDNHSRVNCGMSHAGDAWKAIIKLLYETKPEIRFFDKVTKKEAKLIINNDEALFHLLKSAYAHEGSSVDDFLTSIDLIEQPLKSKEYLRQTLNADNELARIPVHINAGVINYRTGLKIRIDENYHVHTVLDDVAAIMRYVMGKLPENHPEKVARSSTQKPVCGLVCSPYISNPRETLVKYMNLTQSKDLDVAGSVFLVTGINVLNPFSSFGPYKLGGICYSIMVLGIRDYYVIGKDSVEASSIKRKILNDPILNVIIKHFDVKMHLLTLSEIHAKGVQEHVTSVDEKTKSIIKKVLKEFPKHEKSVLNRKVLEPELLSFEKA